MYFFCTDRTIMAEKGDQQHLLESKKAGNLDG